MALLINCKNASQTRTIGTNVATKEVSFRDTNIDDLLGLMAASVIANNATSSVAVTRASSARNY